MKTAEEKAKEKLFKTIERIEQINNTPFLISENKKKELENLHELKMIYWSEWKDPK